MRRRLAAYSHDTVGLGHLRRTMAICRHLGRASRNLSTLVVSGSPFVQAFGSQDRIDFLKLPSARKLGNGNYESRFLNLDMTDLTRLRGRVIDESLRAFDPGLLLVDKTPSGMGGELLASLRRIRASGRPTRVVLGLRDVLDEPEHIRREWTATGEFDVIEELYDEIWVYGSPEVFDTTTEYDFPEPLRRRTKYLGYIPKYNGGLSAADVRSMLGLNGDPFVVVTTGGGEDGYPLVNLYLEMLDRGEGPPGFSSVVITGPGMTGSRLKRVRERARDLSCRVVEFTNSMTCIVSAAELVVTMGGYNTLTEALALGKRVISIPRVKPRLEQMIRARRFAEMGLLTMLDPATATASDLGKALRSELSRPRNKGASLPFTGLVRAEAEFRALTENLEEREPCFLEKGKVP